MFLSITIFFYLWLFSVIFVPIMAVGKKRNVAAWFIFAFFCGPLPLLILPFLDTLEDKSRSYSSKPVLGSNLKALRGELEKIKEDFYLLGQKLKNLSQRIDILADKEGGAVSEPKPEEKRSVCQISEGKSVTCFENKKSKESTEALKRKSIDREVDFGKKWLNKIGIAIFTIGIALLITYSFQHFTAAYKIITGYLIGFLLFFGGKRFEAKDKFKNYGRVFLGGAGAVIYFTTYAMHHFQASRVMQSQLLNLILLAVVAGGIILYSLKYNSQMLATVAVGLGYLTSTLGDIDYFTLISLSILAIVVLFLVYKMQWPKLILSGLIFTYLTHFFWIFQRIHVSPLLMENLSFAEAQALINLIFLFIYWFVFFLGVHLLSGRQNKNFANKLSSANFLNSILFFLTAYPFINNQFPDYKFIFLFGLGTVYFLAAFLSLRLGRKKLFNANILIAISLLTLSVPIRLLPYHTNIVWLVEIPFLFGAGLIFKKSIFRYFSYFLSLILLVKFILVDSILYGHVFREVYLFAGYFSWAQVISIIAILSMLSCFFLARHFKKKSLFTKGETGLAQIFLPLATVYLIILNLETFPSDYFSFALAVQAVILSLFALWLKDMILRRCAFFIYFLAAFSFLLAGDYPELSLFARRLIIAAVILSFHLFYFFSRQFFPKKAVKASGAGGAVEKIVYSTAAFLTIIAVYRCVGHLWISLVLGFVGTIYFLVGFFLKDKLFRLGGLFIFGITFIRIVFIDLAGLPAIHKIVSFIALGILFLSISFIYAKRYPTDKT